MPTGNLKLTSLDKKILHSYCQTLDGLSNYLGNGYEIVLHSLEDYEHSATDITQDVPKVHRLPTLR